MIKPITSVKVKGRRVIVRAGLDVPLKKNVHTEHWEVADDTRITDLMPTLQYLIEQKAKIVIISHLGRPKGWQVEKSLWPAAHKLGELLGFKTVAITDKLPDYKTAHVNFLSSDITKKDYSGLSRDLIGGDILFLENLRYYPQEAENDEKFAKLLATFGDVYVNEAFSVSHREETSIVALARLLPAYAGVSLAKEIASFHKLLRNPKKPMVLLLGGAKIDEKVATLNHLAANTQSIILGGAIANTFLKAYGYEIGKSAHSNVTLAREILRNYKQKITLPIDLVVVTEMDGRSRLTTPDKVRGNEMILDIGPESIRKFATIIKQAKTLVWNGPFGLIEEPRFSFGSRSIAHIFAARCKGFAYGVIGGGETLEVVKQAKAGEFIDHLSTGGGAMLEALAGKELPGIKVLDNHGQRRN